MTWSALWWWGMQWGDKTEEVKNDPKRCCVWAMPGKKGRKAGLRQKTVIKTRVS